MTRRLPTEASGSELVHWLWAPTIFGNPLCNYLLFLAKLSTGEEFRKKAMITLQSLDTTVADSFVSTT